ncbi:Phosphoenolpyruvate synthase [Cupriavidus basilensis]|uniref:Phosphoenolpyruvate synthase n=1 Tax=Cupriavidus basilensis TaxID=68895 RepID=A0A0C4YBZ6_9BURK|nr:Phosphoenolpyruvate synthase [Cupriavidus basilensis]
MFDEICQGCGRSAMEVSNWVFMDDKEKQAVWERITREGKGKRFRQG